MGMSSLGTAVSGLSAAQAGLYVIGHNMANVDTYGFTRQRVLQNDFYSRSVGYTARGLLQVGLGTNITSITQIRDKFLDLSYRQNMSKANYYSVRYEAGSDLQTILGELESDYKLGSSLDDLWNALGELSVYQPGLETRGAFMESVIAFLTKAKNAYDRMTDYQYELDEQVRGTVQRINSLVIEIDGYNQNISIAEMSGDHANDFRDKRNTALDELSKLIQIDYKEMPNGAVNIMAEGHELLMNGAINRLGLKYTSADYSFVEPVFTNEITVLPCDTPLNQYRALFNFNIPIDPSRNNDNGALKGLLLVRGYTVGNYASVPDTAPLPGDPGYAQYLKDDYNITQCLVPKIQRLLDILVHEVVTSINDALAPYISDGASATGYSQDPGAPYDLSGVQSYVEVFVRKTVDRFNADGSYNAEDPNHYYSLYTLGNIEINPILRQADGYTRLSLSQSGDYENNAVATDLFEKWKTQYISFDGLNGMTMSQVYSRLITSLGTDCAESETMYDSMNTLILQAENKKLAISGVSLDEELKSMLIYQYAYNSSARMLNVIDSMLDRIINGTGRVGL